MGEYLAVGPENVEIFSGPKGDYPFCILKRGSFPDEIKEAILEYMGDDPRRGTRNYIGTLVGEIIYALRIKRGIHKVSYEKEEVTPFYGCLEELYFDRKIFLAQDRDSGEMWAVLVEDKKMKTKNKFSEKRK